MDPRQLSSSASIASPSATAPDGVPRQPTYTTAGTIYNPNSTQPLQPPTRRGRSFKWPSGALHSDLALLPKSALASLSIGRGAGAGSTNGSHHNNNHAGGRFPAFQEYTPLQQNYDRAANPFYDPDHVLAHMAADVPRMRSGNTPAPASSLFGDKHQDKAVAIQASDDDDEDEDNLAMDPLMNMPVKSLHNLASYPNPNQKRAQKVLLRGAKPNLSGLGAAARSNPSPTPHHRSLGPAEDLWEATYNSPSITHSGLSDPSTLVRAQTDLWSNTSISRPSANRSSQARFLYPSGSDDASGSEPVATTLSTGPGAPRPLTAGPPGQRQYRPSTFDSTFKALIAKGEQQSLSNGDHDNAPASTGRHNRPLGSADDPSALCGSVQSSQRVVDPVDNCQTTPWSMGGVPMPHEYLPPIQRLDSPSSVLGPVGTAADSRIIVPAAPRGPLSEVESEMAESSGGRLLPGRMTDESLAARNNRVNAHWYSGADLLGKTTMDHVKDARQRNRFGVIRDGRPSRYEHIKVEDAAKRPTTEHSESLINMLFGSMLRHMQQQHDKDEFRPFGEPAPELVDDSAEGRASFFGKP